MGERERCLASINITVRMTSFDGLIKAKCVNHKCSKVCLNDSISPHLPVGLHPMQQNSPKSAEPNRRDQSKRSVEEISRRDQSINQTNHSDARVHFSSSGENLQLDFN